MRRPLALMWVATAGCLFPDVSGLAAGDAQAPDSAIDSASDAPLRYCLSLSPAPTFCDDFDEGTPVGASWTNDMTTLKSTVTLGQAIVRSAPNAMVATTPPQSGTGSYPAAFLEKDFTGTAHQVVFTADVYIEQADPTYMGAGATIMIIGFDGGLLRLNTHADTSTSVFDDYANPDGGANDLYAGPPEGFNVPQHQWVRFVMTADADMKTIGLTMNTGSGPQAVVPPGWPVPQNMGSNAKVFAGLYYANTTTSGWIVHYDNVVVNVL